MSVKAIHRRRDTSRKEEKLLDKNVFGASEVDCPEFIQVCKVMALAESLELEGWRVKVPPFELGSFPLLRVRAAKKGRRL